MQGEHRDLQFLCEILEAVGNLGHHVDRVLVARRRLVDQSEVVDHEEFQVVSLFSTSCVGSYL